MPTKICKVFVVDVSKEHGPSVIVLAHSSRQALFLAANDPELRSWNPEDYHVYRLSAEDGRVSGGPRVLDHSIREDENVYRRNGWALDIKSS